MAGERIRLEVKEREEVGTRISKRLRRQGLIPGVLYGRSEPHAITIPERDLRRALTSEGGLNAILDVVLEGQKTAHPSILKEYQQDPVKGRLIHVDFQEVRLDQTIHATVPVHLVGAEDSPGIREGGVLSQVSRDVNVEALPMEIPEHLDLDVSRMQMNDTLRLSDLSAPEGVKLLDDPEETVLATVSMPALEVEPEPEPVEGELEEGEVAEGEEGEAPEGAAEESAGGEAAGESGSSGE
jgi:large subunit ribosomal protein L25